MSYANFIPTIVISARKASQMLRRKGVTTIEYQFQGHENY